MHLELRMSIKVYRPALVTLFLYFKNFPQSDLWLPSLLSLIDYQLIQDMKGPLLLNNHRSKN